MNTSTIVNNLRGFCQMLRDPAAPRSTRFVFVWIVLALAAPWTTPDTEKWEAVVQCLVVAAFLVAAIKALTTDFRRYRAEA